MLEQVAQPAEYEPEEQDEDVLNLIDERYQRAAKEFKADIDYMELCRRFYRGEQWLAKNNGRWQTAPKQPWKVRLVINKMISAVEGTVAVFMRSKPLIIAVPNTDDEADRRAARVSEQLLKSRWQTMKMEEKNIEMLTWMLSVGNGFLRVRWDATAGKDVPVYSEPGMDPSGAPMQPQIVEYKKEGLAVVDVLDPFSVSIEPGAKTLDDSAWVIVTEWVKKSDLFFRFGFTPKEEEGSNNIKGSNSMFQPSFLDDTKHKEANKDRCILRTMYERPCEKYPQGRMITATLEKKLEVSDLPGGEIMIVHFRNLCRPGELYALSIVGESIPSQMEYNKTKSQLVENRNLCSRPKLLAANGSMSDDEITNKPGEILGYDPVGPSEPHWMAPPQIPAFVLQELQMTSQDIDDITSRHDASQGRQTSLVKSGRHAEAFRQADQTRFLPQILAYEKGLAFVGKFILTLDKMYLSGEQIVQIVGNNLEADVYAFNMNDVTDNANVKFEIASQWPWDREAMRDQLIYLHQQGVISSERLIEELDIPSSVRMFQKDPETKRNAELENRLFLMDNSEPFDPLPTDDHKGHLEYHAKAINNPEMRKYFLFNREILKNLTEHMNAHHQLVPQDAPPAPAARVNVNVAQLVKSLLEFNPQAVQEIMPYVTKLTASAVGETPTVNNDPKQAQGGSGGSRAPQGMMPGGAGVGMPSGGGDGAHSGSGEGFFG